jgi:hypothetical protein
MEGLGGVLQLQDMANVNRNCIPVFWAVFLAKLTLGISRHLRCQFGKKWKCNFLHFEHGSIGAQK